MKNISNKKSQKRLIKEFQDTKNIEGINIIPPQDMYKWITILDGPPDTPYQNGKFKIQFIFPKSYPFMPPSVKFLDNVYHPNIYRDGKICIDILENRKWSPSMNVRTVLQSLRSLFMDPNPSSPANRQAAHMYINNYEKYCHTVIEYIDKMT